jgi:ubiquinone/menaquinone biosynthesis C-methylase UbiE
VVRALSKFNINISQGIRAAEIGCGQGAFLFPFAKYCYTNNIPFKLDGYDIAFNAIQLAAKYD